jgi:hypothetical protein
MVKEAHHYLFVSACNQLTNVQKGRTHTGYQNYDQRYYADGVKRDCGNIPLLS